MMRRRGSRAILFNEKVMVGLGKGLARDGRLEPAACARALDALGRFARLAEGMGVRRLRTVATAAVRDASNGAEFLAQLRQLRLDPELLSGEAEATGAGWGVLAGIPDADGVVGDLGGGSLELTRVADGRVHERLSLPLGVLRLGALLAQGPGVLEALLDEGLRTAGWRDGGRGRPFYLVGGSWRALAKLDMHLSAWPLPILHHHEIAPDRVPVLLDALTVLDRRVLREDVGLAAARLPALPNAAVLLGLLAARLGSSALIASAYGLREGLLHLSLPAAVQAQDPLIAACRDEGLREGRFPEHGDLLDRWIAPLFADEDAAHARLRHAACLLADTAWRAHPEFRAQRGLDVALHGNWVGIDARGRAIVARALWRHYGADGPAALLDRLAAPDDLARADRWGLAIRLGQRLSGGVAEALTRSRLILDPETVTLRLAAADRALFGEAVERRLKALATALGRRGAMVAG